nr:MAG TPA: hypothetical protein [Caudoviricetes sp.]
MQCNHIFVVLHVGFLYYGFYEKKDQSFLCTRLVEMI